MPRFLLLRCFCVLAVCYLAAGGCAGSGEKLYPVSGAVEVEGKPLTFGGVTFHPAADKGNTTKHTPISPIGSDGRYQLVTGTRPGAPAGWYRVLVHANPAKAPSLAPPKFATNIKYTREETTDILVEVVANQKPNAYNLQLTK
jgi:hypothetical protein